MGILADRLDGLRIETSSPDGLVTGTFRLEHGVSIQFRDNAYRHYRERGLEHQLSALAARWWRDYLRARDTAVAEASIRPVDDDEPWDANSRRFRAERDASGFQGMSARGYVYVQSTGLLRWQIIIRDGALSALDEDGFADELRSGYAAMMTDYRVKLMRLRDKHYPR